MFCGTLCSLLILLLASHNPKYLSGDREGGGGQTEEEGKCDHWYDFVTS